MRPFTQNNGWFFPPREELKSNENEGFFRARARDSSTLRTHARKKEGSGEMTKREEEGETLKAEPKAGRERGKEEEEEEEKAFCDFGMEGTKFPADTSMNFGCNLE